MQNDADQRPHPPGYNSGKTLPMPPDIQKSSPPVSVNSNNREQSHLPVTASSPASALPQLPSVNIPKTSISAQPGQVHVQDMTDLVNNNVHEALKAANVQERENKPQPPVASNTPQSNPSNPAPPENSPPLALLVRERREN
mmetsp:Transcript_5951/g.8904  ORF Transcript_5951/g.8904 Transcript_5951/m.8904 type:complete len:141 (+) Transcript_5951:554-976(+)